MALNYRHPFRLGLASDGTEYCTATDEDGAPCGGDRIDHPTDSDYALAPPPKPLSPEEILRRGILSLEEESSEAVERLVTSQEETYRAILKTQGPEPLIEALLARDRQLARTGREMATGRAASRMLREFVRGLLNLADYRSVRAVGDATKTGQIEKVLEALGAEPADLRQLKLRGTTFGGTAESGTATASERPNDGHGGWPSGEGEKLP